MVGCAASARGICECPGEQQPSLDSRWDYVVNRPVEIHFSRSIRMFPISTRLSIVDI